MKLNALQWSWMIAGGVFFVALILDIANVINIPDRLLIVISIALFLVSWLAGPSFKQLFRAHRRG